MYHLIAYAVTPKEKYVNDYPVNASDDNLELEKAMLLYVTSLTFLINIPINIYPTSLNLSSHFSLFDHS